MMSTLRTFALLTAIFAATVATLVINAHAKTLSLSGSSTKVCQLIGDTDWATGMPTSVQTNLIYGLAGTDLGFPVDTGAPSPLYFLFGDTIPNGHPANSLTSIPADDALGYTTQTAAPNSANCLGLALQNVVSTYPVPIIKYLSPTVQPPIQQGSFNVPSGGAFLNNALYAFFWTDHCAFPTMLAPAPATPLDPPSPSTGCPETPRSNSIGQSVLAQASLTNPVAFTWTPPTGEDGLLFRNMPSGFVYVSAAADALSQTVTVKVSSTKTVSGYPVFGVARYRASIPYLAIAPSATFGDPTTWIFFSGTAEKPVWLTRTQWEANTNSAGQWTPPKKGAEIYAAQPPAAPERCVGEHSVTYNVPLGVWLLLYNCPPWTIEARFAPQPWGPWSPPIVLLSPVQDPNIVCTLIQNDGTTGCPGKTGPTGPGGFYAPFVLNRFTTGSTTNATIYWLVSTHIPYTVVVMQSTLQLAP